MWGDRGIVLTQKTKLLFQSSPHVCEATIRKSFYSKTSRISILAPRMWGDKGDTVMKKISKISILAPRMWGDDNTIKVILPYLKFQSSPHVCEATSTQLLPSGEFSFQSSPHVCEATNMINKRKMFDEISILAPRMWGDKIYGVDFDD